MIPLPDSTPQSGHIGNPEYVAFVNRSVPYLVFGVSWPLGWLDQALRPFMA